MQVAQRSAVASSQSEEGGLLVPLQLVDGVNTTADIQPALPLGAASIFGDGLGLSVGHWVAELLHFAASLLVSSNPSVERLPLKYDLQPMQTLDRTWGADLMAPSTK